MSLRRAFATAFAATTLVLCACEPVDIPPTGGSTRDAGAKDGGATDAGTQDAGALDAGAIDAGTGMDGGGGDGGPTISFSTDIAPILMTRCSACHQWTHGTLVGQTGSMSGCSGQPLVVAGNASMSHMYLKVTNDPAKCGGAMPQGTSGLGAPETDKIRSWIQAGAPNN